MPNPSPDETRAPLKALRLHCHWTDEDGEGNWDTDCGQKFWLENDGPKRNGMKFCCYCGKPLKEAKVAHAD